MISVKKSREL
jgi:hydroxyacylglutathione hydrolase